MDTLGLLLLVVVHSAAVQDRDGAKLVLRQLGERFRKRLRVVFADAAYAAVVDWCWWIVRRWRKVQLVIVSKKENQQGFQVLPKRWIVERTFGWLGRWRRLTRDYEYLPESSEALIRIAMIGLMLRRLAPVPARR